MCKMSSVPSQEVPHDQNKFVKFFCRFSSVKLSDQRVGPKDRPCLPPRLIRRSALRGGEGLRRIRRWSLSISLHLGTKAAPSGGRRSLYLTLFHPRMTRLSLDSLILISLFPLYACPPLFDSPCLAEFMRGSCSRSNPTG